VTAELQIYRCESCETNLFPARLHCPNCGNTRISQIKAGPGKVEQETTLRRETEPIRLGSVRLAAGPVVIARLAPAVGTTTQVRLEQQPDGAIHARERDESERSN
jgi:uncharacterized OB-fold protein